MSAKLPVSTRNGPAQKHVSRLKHLETLLRYLPISLPDNASESLYVFGLDKDNITDGGLWQTLNHNLECCFQTHKLRGKPLKFTERGTRLVSLITVLKTAIFDNENNTEREPIHTGWLNRLVKAAEDSGARIPLTCVRLSDDRLGLATAIQQISNKAMCPSINASTAQSLIPIIMDSGSNIEMVPTRSSSPMDVEESEPETFTYTTRKAVAKNAHTQASQQECVRGKQAIFPAWKKVTAETKLAESCVAQAQNMKDFTSETIHGWEARAKAEKKQKHRNSAAARQQKHHNLVKEKAASKGRSTTEQEIEARAEGLNIRSAHQPEIAWSSAAIAKYLHATMPKLFKQCTKGSMHCWLKKDAQKHALKGWSKTTKASDKRMKMLPASGHVGILAHHPEVVTLIVDKLRAFCTSGLAINVFLARSVTVSIVSEETPKLLEKFKCLESWVRDFLETKLNWSPRKGTSAAASVPPDAPGLCQHTFFWIKYAMKWLNIPPEVHFHHILVITMEQTGVYLLPGNVYTYHNKGTKNVPLAAKDKKRVNTLCIITTPTGDCVLFQQSFSMCKAKQWDLSAKTLTSNEADQTLSAYIGKDTILRDEVIRYMHHQTADALSSLANDLTEPEATDNDMIDKRFGSTTIMVLSAQTVQSVKARSHPNTYGAGLSASGAYEGMWAWDDKGEMFSEGRMPVQEGNDVVAPAPENKADDNSNKSSDSRVLTGTSYLPLL
ncbi:hypothetical protein PENSPDRAFT_662242 [Peniophora sp. CONT]|nr:hypothetical protein PENSPDRAFT_662242 [Peniophora sp. CONT]